MFFSEVCERHPDVITSLLMYVDIGVARFLLRESTLRRYLNFQVGVGSECYGFFKLFSSEYGIF